MSKISMIMCSLLLILLLGCNTASPAEPAATAMAQTTPTEAPTVSPRVTLPPTQPPTETPPPTVTATPTVTPPPTPLHPLMIERLRQQSYPGSELVFEQTLEAGGNYDRHVVSYQSEGNKIYALLTVPQGQPPESGWPVVIFNHGYIPPEQYRTTERYVNYVDGFARNGYIVLRSDYRGHGNSEGEASGGYGSPGYTIDVLNAVASIKQYPPADPERIGMWGHSMGGHITLRSMVVTDDIKVGVIWAGVVVSYPDLLTLWRRDRPTPTPDPTSNRRRWRYDLAALYGSLEENPEFWAAISSNSYISDLSGPIQLHHGTADSSVPVEFSVILHDELQAAGMVGELYIYENDNHNIGSNFTVAMERSVAYFDAILKSNAATTPASAAPMPMVFSGEETINIRSGPAITHTVVGSMRAQQTLPVVGRNANATWWQVEVAGGTAWVSAEVVRAINVRDIPVVNAGG